MNAFHALPVDRIAVFVNRGDHRVSGEGSSGICWLSDEGTTYFPEGMLQQVLSRMDVGGFIVTDGSNAVEALAPYWNRQNSAGSFPDGRSSLHRASHAARCSVAMRWNAAAEIWANTCLAECWVAV